MSQYRRSQKKKNHRNKLDLSKKDFDSLSSARDMYESININLMFIRDNIDIMTGSFDAVRYQMQHVVDDIRNVDNALRHSHHSISSLPIIINSASSMIQREINEIHSNSQKLLNSVKNITEVSQDPVLVRTIADLKEMGDRFGDIIE